MDEIDRLKWFSRAVLGKELDLESSEEKELVQNAVFISQLLGANWTYDFSWDIRKIISKTLAQDLFLLKKTELSYSPTPEDAVIVNKLKNLDTLLKKYPVYNRREDAYELAAAALFLKNSMSDDELSNYLLKAKPWFSQEHIQETVKYAKTI